MESRLSLDRSDPTGRQQTVTAVVYAIRVDFSACTVTNFLARKSETDVNVHIQYRFRFFNGVSLVFAPTRLAEIDCELMRGTDVLQVKQHTK